MNNYDYSQTNEQDIGIKYLIRGWYAFIYTKPNQ